MSRPRLAAVAVLAVIALVAGAVALALHATGGSGPHRPVATAPTDPGTPTDVTAGVDAGPGVEVSVGQLTRDGVDRSYLVLAPPSPRPATPLVVGLHGRGATPGEEATRDGLVPYVAAGQAVLVYPVGDARTWNDGTSGSGQPDDVAFVGAVVDEVRAQFALTGPTDLVGFDVGGRLAAAIACRDARRYDAVATLAAVPPAVRCDDADVALPLFAGVSLDDPELPTAAAPQPVPTVLADLEGTWTDRDDCLGSPTVSAAGAATVRTWTACAAGSVVETVAWTTGGHVWPQVTDVGSPDAADLVWSFLSGVQLRAGG